MKQYCYCIVLHLSVLLSCGNQPLTLAKAQGGISQDSFWIYLLQKAPYRPDCSLEKRSIWLLGGIGNGASLIRQVDFFDPVSGTFYADVTRLPQARMFAGITAYDGRIYVMGGLDATGTALQSVDVFDVCTGSWQTAASMPQRLQGFVSGVAGNAIYALAGTTTNDMATGTLFNTVYKYSPSLNSWTTITSNSTILAAVDAAGCSIDGVLFFNTGRLYNTGVAQFASDGYVPASNTTTNLAEASFSQARHGAAAVCYRPRPFDRYPGDPQALMVLGGSSLANTAQPASAILPSNVYDYYRVAPGGAIPNSVTVGPVLPQSLYYPAAEAGYASHRLYAFGGASAVNVPTDKVYSMDLTSPTGTPWATESAVMPIARYGHRAVVVDRQ